MNIHTPTPASWYWNVYVTPRMKTEIKHTGPADLPWSLAWQSTQMSAPSFEYFATVEDAERAMCARHARTTGGS
jgi:hypothetical protein